MHVGAILWITGPVWLVWQVPFHLLRSQFLHRRRIRQSREGRLLRKSDTVILITEDIIPTLQEFRVMHDCYNVIEYTSENRGYSGWISRRSLNMEQENNFSQHPILL